MTITNSPDATETGELTADSVRALIGTPTSRDFDEYLTAVWIGTAAIEGAYTRYEAAMAAYNDRLAAICATASVDPGTANINKCSPSEHMHVLYFRLPEGAPVPDALCAGNYCHKPNPATPAGKKLLADLADLEAADVSMACDMEHAADPNVVVRVFRNEGGRDFLMPPRVFHDPTAARPVLTLRCEPEPGYDNFRPDPALWTRIPVDVFFAAIGQD